MRSRHSLFSLGLLLALTGCVPPALSPVSLKPAQEPQYWDSGKAVLVGEHGGVAVQLTYERQVGSQLVFQAKVTNLRNDRLLLVPEAFTCIAAPGPAQPVPPVDPELRLAQLDRDLARYRQNLAAESNSQGVFAMLFLADLAVGDHSKAGMEQRNQDYNNVHQQSSATVAVNTSAIDRTELERQQWERLALRKTTLEPQQAGSGRLVFAAPAPGATRMAVRFSQGETDLRFEYDLTTLDQGAVAEPVHRASYQ
jgi:hypothetical protein